MKDHKVVSMMVSADWHLGATEPNRFRLEINRLVQQRLDRVEKLDLFIICGDIFDTKEYFSSDTVNRLLLTLMDLLSVTAKFNTQFRFIEGTRTHDAMQLENLELILQHTELGKDRIKFFHEVEEEEIFGLKILYLPEEYVTNGTAYYSEYLKNHYDFIFGHGPTDMMWYMKDADKSVGNYSSATVFKVDDLCKSGRYVFFGHFHYNIHSGPDKRFCSIGPVSRWEFDKDEDCGMYFINYDPVTNVAMMEFLINEYAPILPTVAISVKQDYELHVLNKRIIDKLNPVKEHADKTRLIIRIDSTLKNFIMMRDFIMASFGNIPGVSLLLKVDGQEEKDKEGSEETVDIDTSIKERPYLYDKSMSDEARISAFIRKKTGSNIPLENILEVILPEDNRIKAKEE